MSFKGLTDQFCQWIRVGFDQKSFPAELEFVEEAVREELPVVGPGLNEEAGLLVFEEVGNGIGLIDNYSKKF
jgi:hypothetical protein